MTGYVGGVPGGGSWVSPTRIFPVENFLPVKLRFLSIYPGSPTGQHFYPVFHRLVYDPIFKYPKDPFVCPKNPEFPRSNPVLGMGFFNHQSYSREGSGFLRPSILHLARYMCYPWKSLATMFLQVGLWTPIFLWRKGLSSSNFGSTIFFSFFNGGVPTSRVCIC